MEAPDQRAALAALIERSGASYAALSRLLGRNEAYLQQFVSRGSPRLLSEADRRLLAAFFGIDETVLGAERAASGAATVSVRRLDIAASAGSGTLVEDDGRAGSMSLDPTLIARLGVRADNLSVIRATGRSMEPSIADGDELLVDRSQRRIGPRQVIHVVRIDGALMVKRIARIDTGFRVVSDNPEFAPFEAAKLDVIGRVVWLSRTLG